MRRSNIAWFISGRYEISLWRVSCLSFLLVRSGNVQDKFFCSFICFLNYGYQRVGYTRLSLLTHGPEEVQVHVPGEKGLGEFPEESSHSCSHCMDTVRLQVSILRVYTINIIQ